MEGRCYCSDSLDQWHAMAGSLLKGELELPRRHQLKYYVTMIRDHKSLILDMSLILRPVKDPENSLADRNEAQEAIE